MNQCMKNKPEWNENHLNKSCVLFDIVMHGPIQTVPELYHRLGIECNQYIGHLIHL